MTTPPEPVTPARVPPGQGAPAAGGQPPQQGGMLRQKALGLPVWGWLLIMGGGLAGFLWWRHSQSVAAQNASQTSTQAATTAGTTTGVAQTGTTAADGCTDSSGNSVPCSQADYASQIAALQAEISNLQGAQGQQITSTPSTVAQSQATQTGCTDQNGNPVQCPPPTGADSQGAYTGNSGTPAYYLSQNTPSGTTVV